MLTKPSIHSHFGGSFYMTFSYYLWLCLEKAPGRVNYLHSVFHVEYLVTVSPFIQSLAHACIPHTAVFIRAERSRLQAEVLTSPLLASNSGHSAHLRVWSHPQESGMAGLKLW